MTASCTPNSANSEPEALFSSQFSGQTARYEKCSGYAAHSETGSALRIANVFGTCSPTTICSDEKPRQRQDAHQRERRRRQRDDETVGANLARSRRGLLKTPWGTPAQNEQNEQTDQPQFR